MTGEEISAVLQGLQPASDPERFLACPLSHTGGDFYDYGVPDCGWAGNPDVDGAIADRFDGDGRWPEAADKRTALCRKRFALSVLAGRTDCRELDDPGSTF